MTLSPPSSITLSSYISPNSKVKLYTNIFGEAPWNEGYVCTNTGSLYPLSSRATVCTCCMPAIPTRLFYDSTQLDSIFDILSRKKGYTQTIANIVSTTEREPNPRMEACMPMSDTVYTRTPVGFMWGWDTDIDTINTEKLSLAPDQLDILKNNIQRENKNFNLSDFYYFAEIGVDTSMRGVDIASRMYRTQVGTLLSRDKSDILVRTTRKTDMPYRWFLKMGYTPVYVYGDPQDRVILVHTYTIL